MPFNPELAMSTIKTGRSAIPFLASGLVAVGGLAKSINRIPRGHVGQLLRNNKPVMNKVGGEEVYRQYGPGIRMRVPIWETVQAISVQHRNNDLDILTVDPYSGGPQICVKSSISWRVSTDTVAVHNALFLAQNEAELTRIVVNLCGAGLLEVLSRVERIESVKDVDSDAVIDATRSVCTGPLREYGVELIDMQIQSLNRSPAQVLADGIKSSGLAGFIET